ncbi:trypsin-like peptidase [Haloactinospora alba]|uniref:Trypsin-like peptidase n=1 Tax=Haloactinospora alba TaxID=405555 RepID=A0A543NL26_9ACTN|nr:trypsin-like peptidase domain-containing protein [Haloactinospora alba]TQN32519.1 trypsin-like peptidase [Haloactinospora alba]
MRYLLFPVAASFFLVAAMVNPAAADPGSAGPATPDPSGTTRAEATFSDGTGISAESTERMEDYWTPERMSEATPASPPEGAEAGSGAASRSTGTDGTPGSVPSSQPEGDGPSTMVTESDAAGKVFYTNPSDGKDYMCSASALNSSSKQMVVTAGHCVHGGENGTWMENWTYVPRYREGDRPHGTFYAKQLRTFNGWINDSNLQWDVAMVTTWPQDGDKLVNVTGGHGLSWNYDRSQDVTVLGYPVNKENGEIQWWCQGTTQRVNPADGRLELQCGFGGGASGGPWLREFDDSSGLGHVNGVTSTVTSDDWNRSPYFGDAVKDMFDEQGDVT